VNDTTSQSVLQLFDSAGLLSANNISESDGLQNQQSLSTGSSINQGSGSQTQRLGKHFDWKQQFQ